MSTDSNIVLGLSCVSTVRLIGGPELSSTVKMVVEDAGSGSLKVEELGPRLFQVKAVKEGIHRLIFKIVSGDRVISKTELKVQVVPVGSVKILGGISP